MIYTAKLYFAAVLDKFLNEWVDPKIFAQIFIRVLSV